MAAFPSTTRGLTLDDLENVQGFDSAEAGTPYAFIKNQQGASFSPVSASHAIALDPVGGLELNGVSQLRIKADNTSGDSGVGLSADGLEIVGRVKTAGDTMTGDLDLGGHLVTGLPTTYPPTAADEATSWSQSVRLVSDAADTKVDKDGDTMTGVLTVDTSVLTGRDAIIALTESATTTIESRGVSIVDGNLSIGRAPGGPDIEVQQVSDAAYASGVRIVNTASTKHVQMQWNLDGDFGVARTDGAISALVCSIDSTGSIIGVTDPAVSQGVATKSYVDTGLAGRVNKVGDTMTGDLDMGFHSVKELLTIPAATTDAVNADFVTGITDLKLDTARFTISRALNNIPITDNMVLTVVPELTLMDVDTSDRISSVTDVVGGVVFSQATASNMPLLSRDATLNKYYMNFDGVNDSLAATSYPLDALGGPNGNTTTIFIVANVLAASSNNQFAILNGTDRLLFAVPYDPTNIYVDYGSSTFGRLHVTGFGTITGTVELWTVRVNGTSLQLFRGSTSLTPFGSSSISATLAPVSATFTLGGQFAGIALCEMDLYSLVCYNVALSDADMMQNWRYFNAEFGI